MVSFQWTGKSVSVNDWTRIRVILKKGLFYPVVLASPRELMTKIIPIPYQTAKYKTFRDSLYTEASSVVDVTVYPLAKTYVDVWIEASLWIMKDTDNISKAVIDSLKGSIIDDDRYVRDVHIRRTYHKRDEPDTIRVFVSQIEEPGEDRTIDLTISAIGDERRRP